MINTNRINSLPPSEGKTIIISLGTLILLQITHHPSCAFSVCRDLDTAGAFTLIVIM